MNWAPPQNIHTDKTSLKADREVEGGEGTHLGSLGLTWSLLDSLETMCFAGVLRTSAANGTGEQHHQSKRTGGRKSNQIIPREHQNTSELVQEAPERPHDLAEPLFKSFRQHSCAPTPKGTPEPRRTILTPDPSLRITHAGAIEISRSDSPLNLRYPVTYPLRARVCGALRGNIIL